MWRRGSFLFRGGGAREREQFGEKALGLFARGGIVGGELAELHGRPVQQAVDEETRGLGGAVAGDGFEHLRALGLELGAKGDDGGGGLALVAAAQEGGGGVLDHARRGLGGI